MKIIAIGTGGALGEKLNTNFVIEDNDGVNGSELLCFDCGRTWPEAMRKAGLDWRRVGSVFVSHLHNDHTGGLEFLGFSSYFKMGYPFGQHKPYLVGLWEVIEGLWDKVLRGGMESIQNATTNLDTYFDPHRITPNGSFRWNSTKYDLVQTVHVVDNRRIVPSAGLRFKSDKNIRVFITGDTQFAPNQIMSYYLDSDLIIQDCELASYPGSVHAQYDELKTLPEEVKKKMWLIHCDAELSDGILESAISDGFAGFVREGQVFEV